MTAKDAESARSERIARGWTQLRVGQRAGVDASEVSKFERGLPVSKAAARRILCALRMSAEGISSPRKECPNCQRWQEERDGECSAFTSPESLPSAMLTTSSAGPRCRAWKKTFIQDLLRRS